MLRKHAIFVSYRQADTLAAVGRLVDHLGLAFGDEAVFRDAVSLTAGNFRQQIAEALKGCSIVLVAIGSNWLTSTDGNGRRRLDDPGDTLRIEVETALMRRGPGELEVVPLLIDGARIPPADSLPDTLKELPDLQAMCIRNGAEFRADVAALIEKIKTRAAELARALSNKRRFSETVRFTGGWPKQRQHTRTFGNGKRIVYHSVSALTQSHERHKCQWESGLGGSNDDVLTLSVRCDEGDMLDPGKHWVELKVIWETE